MRTLTISAAAALALCWSAYLLGQNARRDTPFPKDKIATWTAAEMKTVAQQMAATKEVTHRFYGEKERNLEVRRLVGPQPILQHGSKSDFMVIQDGEGTFMTGGQLVNGKAQGEDSGDMRGESIRGGMSTVLRPGDVMYVPAGVPHGFVETKDHVTFIMIRFDTK